MEDCDYNGVYLRIAGLKCATETRMQLLKTIIQRYWALLIMILIVIVALIGVAVPNWYQTYQSMVWAFAFIIALILWTMRKKDEE